MKRNLAVTNIHSSFLSCEKDMETILKKLFIESRPYSDELKRLFVINTKDCLDNKTSDVYNEKIKEIASLHPDLIIVSFGTNEAHSRRYLAQAHKMQIGRLLGMLKAACPEAAFLLTTPPGAYVGRRRARTINPRTVTAARIIKEYAQENKMAVWDMYNIVGGKTDACRNWTKHHMLRADGIHFTPDGYRLQGNLLHQALIKAYNEYVATGLE